MRDRSDRPGALPLPDGSTRFRIWAPFAREAAVEIVHPSARKVPMHAGTGGFFETRVADLGPGADYRYLLDGTKERPDPWSRFQPEGVHGPSRVVDPDAFSWTDSAWKGLPAPRLVIYELHVG
ncbi:MAG TPA: malto-oligosyltrehalose trehalohydrolase, partial [Polyangiaceae bacterium]|nr:malto-oligosyltrehalose trehalohydrolase [Polyangiaceae bacterium]